MTEALKRTDAGPASSAGEASGDHHSRWLGRLLSRFGLAESTDLRGVIESALEREPASGKSFSVQERLMLLNILRFGALRVEDVMVPRADIIAIDNQASLAELLMRFQEAGHSRLPVYQETLDDPRGMVHIKDFMSWIISRASIELGGQAAPPLPRGTDTLAGEGAGGPAGRDPLSDGSGHPTVNLSAVDLSRKVNEANILRDVLYVPPSMSLLDLLLRMQTTRIHLALVVDEYGGTDGLVSIEDLVEEIVGNIEDEHDEFEGPLIREEPGKGLIADARAEIDELEEKLGQELVAQKDEDAIDTLGGLVFAIAGRVPVKGEIVKHDSGLEFEVVDADPRRIKTLRIHRRGPAGAKAAQPAAGATPKDSG
ncbi:MAG: hemolysin family protein [Hyphomicrobiales bacterium]